MARASMLLKSTPVQGLWGTNNQENVKIYKCKYDYGYKKIFGSF